MLTDNLELSLSALNIINDHQKKLIGGDKIGLQATKRITSTF